jgi:hypothetical protein
VERPASAVLDPAFAAIGFVRSRHLLWRARHRGANEAAQVGFSRWNGPSLPLPNRCRLDFSGEAHGRDDWPHMALLTRAEQQPLRELVDAVRRQIDRDDQAFRQERSLLRQADPLPDRLQSVDIEMEYLTTEDLVAQAIVLARLLPVMVERFRSAGELPRGHDWSWDGVLAAASRGQ